MRRANGWTRSPASGRRWPQLWSRASLILGLSDRGGTSRPGSALSLSRTPVGARTSLSSISKQGDRYLRSLFTAGALAVIRYAKIHGTGHRPWLTGLLARR